MRTFGNVGNENPLYTVSPLDELISQNPDFVINLSASPFNYDQAQTRINVLKANVERYGLPMFYCNQVGAQTEIVFDGGSLVMSPDGEVFEELPYFEEMVLTYDLEQVKKGGRTAVQPKDKMELIHHAIVVGIRDYFGKLGFKKAILGLSGGIDSALTCALAVKALGPENVMGVLMPSQYSSDHSIADARQLAETLGMPYKIISVQDTYEAMLKTMSPHFGDLPFNVTEENIQARIRGMNPDGDVQQIWLHPFKHFQ